MSATDIVDAFKKAFPDDTILAHTFKSGGASSFTGEKLVDVQLKSEEWLRIFKLSRSSASYLSGDEIKVKVFPFVYDTKNINDSERRRDILKDKLKILFPQHNVNLFIFNGSCWSRSSNNTKGIAFFEKEYGSEVDIVLC